ncbi:hypothetical protein BD311DRAFT_433699 [Dichomitus squalens]|uniref:Uncharacterized protein n=1 Tax=Dichomitus squalens TaxID=114155 RepID=A0A4Q9MZ30_9APHY|nr:hypothetical protein BD311DRAFT_433699 [Dichomitus squalens]
MLALLDWGTAALLRRGDKAGTVAVATKRSVDEGEMSRMRGSRGAVFESGDPEMVVSSKTWSRERNLKLNVEGVWRHVLSDPTGAATDSAPISRRGLILAGRTGVNRLGWELLCTAERRTYCELPILPKWCWQDTRKFAASRLGTKSIQCGCGTQRGRDSGLA